MDEKPYKPHLQKRGPFWFVDNPLENHKPMSIQDAKLRRLAQRWAGKKNVERVIR